MRIRASRPASGMVMERQLRKGLLALALGKKKKRGYTREKKKKSAINCGRTRFYYSARIVRRGLKSRKRKRLPC